MKEESVSRSRNGFQIQICIPACVMSGEFLAANSQHAVRLKSLRNDEIDLKTCIIKFKKIERAEISELPRVRIHYSLRMQG